MKKLFVGKILFKILIVFSKSFFQLSEYADRNQFFYKIKRVWTNQCKYQTQIDLSFSNVWYLSSDPSSMPLPSFSPSNIINYTQSDFTASKKNKLQQQRMGSKLSKHNRSKSKKKKHLYQQNDQHYEHPQDDIDYSYKKPKYRQRTASPTRMPQPSKSILRRKPQKPPSSHSKSKSKSPHHKSLSPSQSPPQKSVYRGRGYDQVMKSRTHNTLKPDKISASRAGSRVHLTQLKSPVTFSNSILTEKREQAPQSRYDNRRELLQAGGGSRVSGRMKREPKRPVSGVIRRQPQIVDSVIVQRKNEHYNDDHNQYRKVSRMNLPLSHQPAYSVQAYAQSNLPKITVSPSSPKSSYQIPKPKPQSFSKTRSFFFSTDRNQQLYNHPLLTQSTVLTTIRNLNFHDQPATPPIHRFDYGRKVQF